MAVSDPIADFLTKIRNAVRAQHRFVDVKFSKLKLNICEILKKYGFIESFLVKQDDKGRGTIRIFNRYTVDRQPVIQGIKRISKPGSRQFIGYDDIPQYWGGMAIQILSTSKGVMAGRDAKQEKVGGELLCLIW